MIQCLNLKDKMLLSFYKLTFKHFMYKFVYNCNRKLMSQNENNDQWSINILIFFFTQKY